MTNSPDAEHSSLETPSNSSTLTTIANPPQPQDIQKLLHQVARLVAMHEQLDFQIKNKAEIEQQVLQDYRELVDLELQKIHNTLSDFSSMITEVGVARFRLTAEQALKEGQGHAAELEHAIAHLREVMESSAVRLEMVSIEIEQRFSRFIDNFPLNDFKEYVADGCSKVEQITQQATQSMKKKQNGVRFERFGLAFFGGLVSATLLSLYINAQWPWEAHQHSLMERRIGREVIAAAAAQTKAAQHNNLPVKAPVSHRP